MARFDPIIESLLAHPHDLVIGCGCFSRTLACVLGAVRIEPECLLTGHHKLNEQSTPLVLRDLERVTLVCGQGDSSADLLNWHEAVWRWIECFSPERDQHEIAVLFILPDVTSDSLGATLAAGLGLQAIDPATSGHGIVRMSDSLHSICTVLAAIQPMDLPPLRARKKADVRHAALHALRAAETAEELRVSAQRVALAFQEREYLLDLFCRPPGHRNGNLFRAWLREAARGGISFGKIEDAKTSLATWLRDG